MALRLASRTFARRRTNVHIVHDVHQTFDYVKSRRILRAITGNVHRGMRPCQRFADNILSIIFFFFSHTDLFADCKEILFGVHFAEQHAVDGSLITVEDVPTISK